MKRGRPGNFHAEHGRGGLHSQVESAEDLEVRAGVCLSLLTHREQMMS